MSRELPTPDRQGLKEAFETPAVKRRYVQRLFTKIAPRYDLITRLLSFGRDSAWKLRLVNLAAPQPDDVVLDLACGTGDLALACAARGSRVVGLDLARKMIDLARTRWAEADMSAAPNFVVGDMTALPFPSGCADVVTTGYGLRNVPDLDLTLSEIHRVLRTGGRVCALDFDRPEGPVLRSIYLGYLEVVGGALGLALHGDSETYRYIPASIRRYPGARNVCDLFRAAGFVDVRHIRVLGGLMAIHTARKSATPSS